MDWSYKAVLTAITVALLLWVARLFGRRLAGLLAGLPTVTGPALIWLGLEYGAGYAAEAAIGSISACLLCAVFAFAYERASRRFGIWLALAVSCIACVAVAPPLAGLDGKMILALLCAGAGAGFVYTAIPDALESARKARNPAGEIWLTALVSGAVSGAVAVTAPQSGPFWTGVLASPPLIAAVIAMHQHAHAGNASVRTFLRGYVAGLLGRAAFGAGFALLVTPFGVASAALLATAAGCAFTVVSLRWASLVALPDGRRSAPLRKHAVSGSGREPRSY
jgi:hypothetical protein